MSIQKTLTDLPDVVLNELLRLSDIPTKLTLRKVCHRLRSFINDSPECLGIKKLEFRLEPDHAFIYLNSVSQFTLSGTLVEYQQRKGGCLVKLSSRRKLLENEDFTGIAKQDIALILKNQASILNSFVLNFKCDQLMADTAMKEFKHILESLNRLLPIQYFTFIGYTPEQVLSVLPFFNPKTLKNIWIYRSEKSGLGYYIDEFDIQEIVKIDQWKSAKSVIVHNINPKFFNHLSHLESAQISVKSMTLSSVASLEQTFLNSSHLKRLQCQFHYPDEKQEFLDLMGPLFYLGTHSRRPGYWFIRTSKSDEIFRIVFHFFENAITFSHCPLSALPENATILD